MDDPLALPLALSRATGFAGLAVVFGTLLVGKMVGVPDIAEVRKLPRLLWTALGVSVFGSLLWGVLQTAAMAETDSLSATLALVPYVFANTTFGHLVLLRLFLLALTALALAQRRVRPATFAMIPAGFACVLEAGHLHAFARNPGPSLLLASEALHVLAAASWLGGLPALWVLIKKARPPRAAFLARRFSALGIAAVSILAASAALQSLALLGSRAALFHTEFGRICLAKLIAFAVLLGLAARNRFILLSRLTAGEEASRSALTVSLGLAMVLGAVVLVLAALLGTLPPGIDVMSVTSAPEFSGQQTPNRSILGTNKTEAKG
ncbi:MAG: CopD family protein [Acidobacteriia bacterium]|nr:CopD family protein [Methyloceanibacter sp.]MCL6490559.1 CopD family protein [Terriglobia bacterium]